LYLQPPIQEPVYLAQSIHHFSGVDDGRSTYPRRNQTSDEILKEILNAHEISLALSISGLKIDSV